MPRYSVLMAARYLAEQFDLLKIPESHAPKVPIAGPVTKKAKIKRYVNCEFGFYGGSEANPKSIQVQTPKTT